MKTKQLVEALEFEHIKERYYSGSYKFVIGKINLQKLIDNQQRISEKQGIRSLCRSANGGQFSTGKNTCRLKFFSRFFAIIYQCGRGVPGHSPLWQYPAGLAHRRVL
jgi:hypothetical protein